MKFTSAVVLAAVFLCSSAMAAPPLSGAIFTTTVNGDVVNGNTKYDDKCDVYLDGGPPPNAPQQAAGLPDGDYYFQVTDPSGKKLLSTDPVKNRRVTVANGVIVAVFNHNTGDDIDHPPAKTVQLCPYLDTPNNGGVYKAWMTPVGDLQGNPENVDNPCGNGCFHGFLPAASKTDNFKTSNKELFCVLVQKEIITKEGNLAVDHWPIYITDPLGVTNNYYTDENGFLDECGFTTGKYVVREALANNGSQYEVFFTEVDGVSIDPPTDTVNISFTGTADTRIIRFINRFLCDAKTCK